jgi:hypothetical protein
LYDIPGSFKIENNSEKLKGLKNTSWLFTPIDSIILLILANELVVVNIILFVEIYHESSSNFKA